MIQFDDCLCHDKDLNKVVIMFTHKLHTKAARIITAHVSKKRINQTVKQSTPAIAPGIHPSTYCVHTHTQLYVTNYTKRRSKL